jgi:hypothetical protein
MKLHRSAVDEDIIQIGINPVPLQLQPASYAEVIVLQIIARLIVAIDAEIEVGCFKTIVSDNCRFPRVQFRRAWIVLPSLDAITSPCVKWPAIAGLPDAIV